MCRHYSYCFSTGAGKKKSATAGKFYCSAGPEEDDGKEPEKKEKEAKVDKKAKHRVKKLDVELQHRVENSDGTDARVVPKEDSEKVLQALQAIGVETIEDFLQEVAAPDVAAQAAVVMKQEEDKKVTWKEFFMTHLMGLS